MHAARKSWFWIACAILQACSTPGFNERAAYLDFSDLADSLYHAGRYREAAMEYSRAVALRPELARSNDMYNAACSWALAGEVDSAFFQLQQVVSTHGYAKSSHLQEDADLQSLHADARWAPLVEAVKHNREKQAHISKAMWKEDVRQLRSMLDYWHINAYASTPATVWDREVNALLERMDQLDDDGIILEIQRILALAGDGHTSFYTTDQDVVDFQYLPVVFSQFEEGLYVISASDSLADLAGLRLVAIGDTPIEAVREKLIPYIPRDNNAEITYTYPDQLQCVNLLHHLGITPTSEEAELVFDAGGQPVRRTVRAMTGEQLDQVHWTAARTSLNAIASSSHPTFLFSNPTTIPRLMSRPNYWSLVFEPEKVVFVEYLSCWDQEGGPSFSHFVDSAVFATLDAHPDHRLVVDMRYNSGGEPRTAAPLFAGIEARPALFAKNPPTVLVGTRTFSAAATNVCQLKDRCQARLIGQLSRARPYSASEGRSFTLRNSGCEISISTQFVQRLLGVMEPYIPLDEVVPMRFSDYIGDVDLTFETALGR
ncbi:MAG: hypothetical protein WAU70_04180 [Flavobacteriales bacterium]